jgi:hypothetical protein
MARSYPKRRIYPQPDWLFTTNKKRTISWLDISLRYRSNLRTAICYIGFNNIRECANSLLGLDFWLGYDFIALVCHATWVRFRFLCCKGASTKFCKAAKYHYSLNFWHSTLLWMGWHKSISLSKLYIIIVSKRTLKALLRNNAAQSTGVTRQWRIYDRNLWDKRKPESYQV